MKNQRYKRRALFLQRGFIHRFNLRRYHVSRMHSIQVHHWNMLSQVIVLLMHVRSWSVYRVIGDV